MKYNLEPLRVVCNQCQASAETYDYANPDSVTLCDCCPVDHDHAGLGCRPLTIYATAYLTLFDVKDLLEMAIERGIEIPQPEAQEVM